MLLKLSEKHSTVLMDHYECVYKSSAYTKLYLTCSLFFLLRWKKLKNPLFSFSFRTSEFSDTRQESKRGDKSSRCYLLQRLLLPHSYFFSVCHRPSGVIHKAHHKSLILIGFLKAVKWTGFLPSVFFPFLRAQNRWVSAAINTSALTPAHPTCQMLQFIWKGYGREKSISFPSSQFLTA